MPVAEPFVVQVERSLRSLGVGTETMVVAVSGGPDSVALLRALCSLPGVGRLVVAHLNHRLRGEESDVDEAFVSGLPAQLPVPVQVRCECVDIAALAVAEGANVEAVARRVRYDWLGRVAKEFAAPWVATGHSADDQAETILHRLLRGTGLKGLRGIAARRPLTAGVELVRPLLGCTRAEVMDYLRAINQAYRTDSSNADLDYTRNRIRHELLPLLAGRYNPGIVSVLCRLAEQADEAYRAVMEQAQSLLNAAEFPRAGTLLVFDRQHLAAAPRHVIREAFRLVWEREGWPLDAMGFDAWERLAGMVTGENAALHLPGGVHARCAGRVAQIGRGS